MERENATTTKKVNIGRTINKLERLVALASMRGDTEAEQKWMKALEKVANASNLPNICA